MKLRSALVIPLVFALLACSSNQVITDLELAVDAVEVALPLIGPSAGLPADLEAQIEKYLSATGTAVAQASDILAGSNTDAQKAAAIAAAFAGIAVPIVPARYQGIASAVQRVAVLVANFLVSLPTAAPNPNVRTQDVGGAVSSKRTPVSSSDRQRLAQIKAKALAAHRP